MENVRFMARPGFMVREVAGEHILIPIDTDGVTLAGEERLPTFNGMIRLNGLGLLLWQALESPKTMEELVAAVETQYDTQGQNVREDIGTFLDTGIRSQLIFLLPDEK